MLDDDSSRDFDAGIWKGHVDVTKTIVGISMLLGVGILWLSLAKLFLALG